MGSSSKPLNDDAWRAILSRLHPRLDRKDLQSLALVSKQFLVLSNECVRELTFKTLPNDRSFKNVFTRFSSVKEITISSTHIGRALIAISKSKLKLEVLTIQRCPTYPTPSQMNSLAGKLMIKSLSLGWFSKVRVYQVVQFIQLFPALEELHLLSNNWDDDGILRLSVAFPNLRKIDLAGNRTLTDRALLALADNCVNLEKVGFIDFFQFTPEAFCRFLATRRNLTYLSFPWFRFPVAHSLQLTNAVSACQNLQTLILPKEFRKDAALCVISQSGAPLTYLYMLEDNPHTGYTMNGVSAMLRGFQALQKL